MKNKIDPEISLIYGIVNFGKVGMELLHPDKPRVIFKDKLTQIENWLDAVEYAKKRESLEVQNVLHAEGTDREG